MNVDLKILDLRFKRTNSNLNIDLADILYGPPAGWIMIPIYPDLFVGTLSTAACPPDE
jgi:hypothetical protein